MIIDFHTHIFPDDLAHRATEQLRIKAKGQYPLFSDGTLAGLRRCMARWSIDISVVQPVVTRGSQLRETNRWAASIGDRDIICFGGIYPHTDDYRRDIDYVAGLGLKGLKFHPEYQDFVLDAPEMLPIYDYALSKGLILLIHGGYDPAYTAPFRSSPRGFSNVWKAMRGGVIVAAHLGGAQQWDDVEKYLVGTGIYLDTAMGFDYFPHDQFLRIVEGHGADRILFATDSPWSDAGAEAEQLRGLPLSEEEKEKILGGNARRLLGI
ncbi:MAG: amidohydrolase family protein [Bacillota bacterium]|nr:amidohydrolase family protein [Bacillota bacterium]